MLMNNLAGKVMYQMSLRTMSTKGTLRACEELLPHVKSLGVDIVYVCPFFVEDDDMDKEVWSIRQKASGCENPKNPYKIADYFNIDEEYGTDEEFESFVKTAHSLGLEVMLDLVYLHCSRNAVFIKDHPDFVERSEDGGVKVGARWPFARLNYSCPELREYLYSNMEYFVKRFDIDGYRCDVGDSVPLDFWKEGIARVRKIKPDFRMLNEGSDESYPDNGFDSNYMFKKRVLIRGMLVGDSTAAELCEYLEGGFDFRQSISHLDNHDTVTDDKGKLEVRIGTQKMNASHVLIFTLGGTPFLWNGAEVCDENENNMFSNRFFGRRNSIDWSGLVTDKGKHRMKLIKRLSKLYHSEKALSHGETCFVKELTQKGVMAYERSYENENIWVFINFSDVECDLEKYLPEKDFNVILVNGAGFDTDRVILDPNGYIILKEIIEND